MTSPIVMESKVGQTYTSGPNRPVRRIYRLVSIR